MDETREEIRIEHRDDERRTHERAGGPAPWMEVREDDLEPHAGLRYIARLFKVLSILLILVLIFEIVLGLVNEGASAIPTLLVEATRLIVFAGFLWGAADIALMLIESNHDLRALRILVGRTNGRIERIEERFVPRDGEPLPPQRHAPPDV